MLRIAIALGALSVIAHWFMPRLTRPALYFSVTVAPGFRDISDGHSILTRYRRWLLAVAVPALALLLVLTLTRRLTWTPLALLLLISHHGTTGSRFAGRGLRCGSGLNRGAEPHTNGSRR